MTAEAFNSDDTDPATDDLVERALTLARQVGDRRTESAALDQLTAMQLARGEVRAAAASAMRRTEILAPLPVTATTGLEFFDSYLMAAECQLAAGDLPSARRMAESLQDLPFCREEGHLATARLLVVAVLAGDWSEAAGLAERFREGWERAGRPQVGNLRSGAYAAATMYGLRGDDNARAAWLDIVGAVRPPGRPIAAVHFGEFFDALLLLHRGLPDQVMHLMTTPTGGLHDLVRRHVASLVRRLVGRGRRAHRVRGGHRPHPPRPGGDGGQPDRHRHRRPRGCADHPGRRP